MMEPEDGIKGGDGGVPHMAKSVTGTTDETVDSVVDIFETAEAAAFEKGIVLALALPLHFIGHLVQTYLVETLVGLEKVNNSLAKVDLQLQAIYDPLGKWRDGIDEELLLVNPVICIIGFAECVVASGG